MSQYPDRNDQIGQRYSDSYDPSIGAPVAAASAAVRAAFIQKVYMTTCAGVAIAMGVAFQITEYAVPFLGTKSPDFLTSVATGRGFWITFIVYMGMAMAAGAVARVKGLNLLVYGLFAAVTGAVIAPLFLMAYIQAGMSYSVIWNAFALSMLMFGGLSAYVLVSGKDFSFLGGMLWIGLLVLIGFMVGTFFFQAPAFVMAVTVGGLLLFGGFVLYDTSVIVHHLAPDEWVAGALRLFIDFINIFIRILSLLSNRR